MPKMPKPTMPEGEAAPSAKEPSFVVGPGSYCSPRHMKPLHLKSYRDGALLQSDTCRCTYCNANRVCTIHPAD